MRNIEGNIIKGMIAGELTKAAGVVLFFIPAAQGPGIGVITSGILLEATTLTDAFIDQKTAQANDTACRDTALKNLQIRVCGVGNTP
ncbi:MAG: hypothetical protein AAF108_08020 [Planctomycetota bacterium]